MLNETKLGKRPTPRLSGYRVAAIRNRSVDKVSGGGVAIYVTKELQCTDISPDIDDIAAIEIKTKQNVRYCYILSPLIRGGYQ